MFLFAVACTGLVRLVASVVAALLVAVACTGLVRLVASVVAASQVQSRIELFHQDEST